MFPFGSGSPPGWEGEDEEEEEEEEEEEPTSRPSLALVPRKNFEKKSKERGSKAV